MNKYFLSILLLCCNAVADPFFGTTNITENAQLTEVEIDIAKNNENLTACKPSTNLFSINLPTEFEKLKLVGLIKIDNSYRALFIDEKDQLFDFRENELVNNHQIEIKTITLKSITYIDWKLTQHCNTPYEVTLKL